MPRQLIELFVRDDGFICKASEGDRHYMKPKRNSLPIRAIPLGSAVAIKLSDGHGWDQSIAYRAIKENAKPGANAYSLGYHCKAQSGEHPVQFFRILESE